MTSSRAAISESLSCYGVHSVGTKPFLPMSDMDASPLRW